MGGEAFLVASELLSIQIRPAASWSVKFLQVPVLVSRDEFLLKHIGLHLGLAELTLDVLQHAKLLPVLLLELFHLPEQLELLLVNDLLGLVLKGVSLVKLVVSVANLSFLLFAVDLRLKLVNLTLRDIEHVGDLLDPQLAGLCSVPLLHDPCLNRIALFGGLVLDESGLFIDELTLGFLNLLR